MNILPELALDAKWKDDDVEGEYSLTLPFLRFGVEFYRHSNSGLRSRIGNETWVTLDVTTVPEAKKYLESQLIERISKTIDLQAFANSVKAETFRSVIKMIDSTVEVKYDGSDEVASKTTFTADVLIMLLTELSNRPSAFAN